jgi:cell volume regulation protein A
LNEVLGLLTLVAGTIIVGYTGRVLFKRTGLSDAIWLLAMGLSIGPGLGLVQAATFHAVLPFLSAFALIFVLFDAGLGLDLRGTALGFTRSVFLGVVGMIVCSVAVAGVAVLFDFSWIEGLLLGTIVSGTSSVTVIALAEKLPISASAKTVLTLESVLSDPLVIVVPLTRRRRRTAPRHVRQRVAARLVEGRPLPPVSADEPAGGVGPLGAAHDGRRSLAHRCRRDALRGTDG